MFGQLIRALSRLPQCYAFNLLYATGAVIKYMRGGAYSLRSGTLCPHWGSNVIGPHGTAPGDTDIIVILTPGLPVMVGGSHLILSVKQTN